MKVSIWDEKSPWASIAHAIEYYEGLPEVVVVPQAPAASFVVNHATVVIREAADSPGVACRGHQVVEAGAKLAWLMMARRERGCDGSEAS